MTTEEKNALAKEYAKQNAAPFNYKLHMEGFDTPEMLATSFEAGLSRRDEEVENLVDVLRVLRDDVHHTEVRALQVHLPDLTVDECRIHALKITNVQLADSLLSKYPVNNLPNG